MRKLINFIMIICILLSGSLQAQTLLTSCSSQFQDNGGNASNYLDNENSDWLICPDTLSEYLILEFTHVDIEAALDMGTDSTGCNDVLYVFDGLNEKAPMVGSFCGEESGDGDDSFISGNTLRVGDQFKPTNSSGCFYIKFESNNAQTRSGWMADISCCTPTLDEDVSDGYDLPIATNGGHFITVDMDNTCVRDGRLSDFTDFEGTGESCFSAGLTMPNRSFYAFQANHIGGFAELLVEPVDSVGNMEMIIFGPVELDSTETYYTGGFINYCVYGEEPESLFFNAGPNQTYILAVGTEKKGKTLVTTLENTISLGGVLPVSLESYDIEKRGKDALLSWTTSEEINNDRYDIYKSSDGKSFQMIGSVDGKNNGNNASRYSFIDKTQSSGTYYYYISQVDLDGQSKDFDILEVSFSGETQFGTYPNPSNGRFSVHSNGTEATKVIIYNQVGRLVYSNTIQPNSEIDLTEFGSGLYTVKSSVGGITSAQQHIVLR